MNVCAGAGVSSAEVVLYTMSRPRIETSMRSMLLEDEKEDFAHIAQDMMQHLEIKDRKYRLKTYKKCFTGRAATTLFIKRNYAQNEEEATMLGNAMMAAGVFFHVTKDHEFKNEEL